MIEVVTRTGASDIYRRSGDASFWFELTLASSGKKKISQMRYTSGITVSLNELVEPYDQLLYADPGTNTMRLSVAIAKGGDPTNPENQYPTSEAYNTFVEAMLLTALDKQVVISKPKEPARSGLYYDLQAAGLLDEFDIDGMARFLAGIGVVENSINLSDNTTVKLTTLQLPENQPVMSQLTVLTMNPLWDLCESIAFYGIIPYLWVFGLLDFKTFCDRVHKYWPTRLERENFIFNELTTVIKSKRSTALTETQTDLLMKNAL